MEGSGSSTMDLIPMNTTVSPVSPGQTIYTYPELVLLAVCFSIMIIVTVVGNSLVLVAVARTKKLQNVTNVFVVNLSVSDCLSSFAFLWSVPGMVSTTPGYPLQSNVPCVASAGLLYLGVGCGMYSLANIALNRCLLITRPMQTYQWLYTPKKVALMVLTSCLVPLCAVIIPPLSGTGGLGFDPDSRTCTDIDTYPRAPAFDKIVFSVFYPIPFVVIVVSYVLIWRHVRRHFKERLQSVRKQMQTSAASVSTITLDLDVDDSTARSSRTPVPPLRHAMSSLQLNRTRSDQLAITKNLFLVVFIFVVCFTPLGIMLVINSNRYQLYAGMLLFVSGCVNPGIYATKHPHFRPVLRSMIRCRWSEN